VLSSDKSPPPADRGPYDYTKFQLHEANSLLAETLATENVIVPGSGHSIMVYAPQVVADKIIAIVDKVRTE
jgi:pimeloyl-ACP methyl ester carboxylesterase